MLIARSLWRRLIATVLVLGGFVWLYETTIFDSRFALHLRPVEPEPAPRQGSRLQFGATAYCKGTTTASGVNVRSGIAAADPALLPVGSVVQVDAPGDRHDGVYTIMDTGPKVQGRHLDLYMWSCHEALAFGRTGVKIEVLRLGWSPQASSPGIIDRLFRRREEAATRPREPARIPPSTLPDPARPVEPEGAGVAPPPTLATDVQSPGEADAPEDSAPELVPE